MLPPVTPGDRPARRHFSAAATTLLALVASASLTACPPNPASHGTLRISGSNTVFSFVTALAQGYHPHAPSVEFKITGDGTARGIKFTGEGQVSGLDGPLMSQTFGIPTSNAGVTTDGEPVNIGMSSRDPLPDEREAYPTIQTFTFAYDALAIVIDTDVTGVTNLTRAQLHDIYTGAIANWNMVGGPDHAITVVARDPISGTAGAWNSLVMHGDPVVSGAVMAANNVDVPTQVGMNPFSIGYVSTGFVTPDVTEVTVEGIMPSMDNVLNGSYPLVRPLELVTSGAPTALEHAFIAYCYSPEGQAIIRMQGDGDVPAPAPAGFLP